MQYLHCLQVAQQGSRHSWLVSRQGNIDDTSCIRATAEKHRVWQQAVDDSSCQVLSGSCNMSYKGESYSEATESQD